jgi:hypothetical protein
MKTEMCRDWHQSINYDKPYCRQVSFYGPKWTPSREEHLTHLVGTVSKCTKDAETVYARLVMVSISGWKREGNCRQESSS